MSGGTLLPLGNKILQLENGQGIGGIGPLWRLGKLVVQLPQPVLGGLHLRCFDGGSPRGSRGGHGRE